MVIPAHHCCNIVTDLITGILPGVVDEASTDWCIFYSIVPGSSGTLSDDNGNNIICSVGGEVAAATALQALIPLGRAGLSSMPGGAFAFWVGLPAEPTGWTWFNGDDFTTTPVVWIQAVCTTDDTPQQLQCWEGSVDYSLSGGAVDWFPYIADLLYLGHVHIFSSAVPNGYTEPTISASYDEMIKAIFGIQASGSISVVGDVVTLSIQNTWFLIKHQHDLNISDGVTQTDIDLIETVCP